MSQVKTPHPAHAVFKDVPEEKSLVRVYNRAEGALKHEIRIEDGTTAIYEIKGQSFAKVPKAVADLWLSQFPDRIVSDNEAQKLVAGAQAEVEKVKAELAETQRHLAAARAKSDPKGELARLTAEVEKHKTEANELRRQNGELLEKATAPAAPEAPGGI